MGAVRKLQRQQQAPDRKEVWEADIKTAESKLFRYANKVGTGLECASTD